MKTNKLLMTVILSALVAPVFAQTVTPRIDAREANQQQRIANGVASGQLTAKETQHLEARESKLVADEKMAKADGVVTSKERARLTREENRDSRAIYKKKHNGKVQ
jgi:GH35 family endo-1,4-beta-xylanase